MSAPAGINCGQACDAVHGSGGVATLMASAGRGWQLTAWGGACTGAATCEVTMNQGWNVTATFMPKRFRLTVLPPGVCVALVDACEGSGIVTSVLPPVPVIACTIARQSATGGCIQVYDSWTVVTLIPRASNGSIFGGWDGDCKGATQAAKS